VSSSSPSPTEPCAPPELDIIDRDELARRLEVHPRTVQRMVARGELPRPCLGAGGRPRWLWSYVVEYCRKRHERDEELDRRRHRKLR
jgi:excisionase family DNA binding protein